MQRKIGKGRQREQRHTCISGRFEEGADVVVLVLGAWASGASLLRVFAIAQFLCVFLLRLSPHTFFSHTTAL
jgi:hypothetical protein